MDRAVLRRSAQGNVVRRRLAHKTWSYNATGKKEIEMSHADPASAPRIATADPCTVSQVREAEIASCRVCRLRIRERQGRSAISRIRRLTAVGGNSLAQWRTAGLSAGAFAVPFKIGHGKFEGRLHDAAGSGAGDVARPMGKRGAETVGRSSAHQQA